jgi:hypothetical protein
MKAIKIEPFGRAPLGSTGYKFHREKESGAIFQPVPAAGGEEGYRFFREKEGGRLAPPLPKGSGVANESLAVLAELVHPVVEEIEPPAFMGGGDYIVYSVTLDDESKPYIAVKLVNGVPHIWLIDEDQVIQGPGAVNFMVEAKTESGVKWEWGVCDPMTVVKDVRRQLIVAMGMYPELGNTALVADMGDGLKVFGPMPEFQQMLELKLATVSEEN